MSVSSFQMHAQILPLSHEKQGADKKSIYLGRRIAKQVSFSSEERLISPLASLTIWETMASPVPWPSSFLVEKPCLKMRA